ncbi:MAG: hypothetical protein AAFX10_14535, partial [Pseudomonadota bacterium]
LEYSDGDILVTFFAHSTDSPDQSDWQTLASHLSAVGALAAERAAAFDAAEYGRAAVCQSDWSGLSVE